ncbi:MAG: gliding motility-associated C-terminal domain-containing protein [Saprospiraceae bacterium]|nr:gliding motility-associated C-terminal domain-containing protein [Saprospiraceae bacterium]
MLSFPTAGADSCISGVLPDFSLAAQLPSGSALYSVANFNGSLSAPFSFDDFPATMLDECDYTNNLDSFVIQLPGSEVSIRDENCKHPCQIIITANGGTPPFEYKLNDGPWGSANIFGGLSAGDYSLSVRDASGCEGTGTYTIQPYIPLAIRLDSIGHIDCTQHEGFIAVSATGGAPPYLFQLLTGTPQTNGYFDDLLSGTYTVVVTDKDTCDGRLEGLTVAESLDSVVVIQTVDLCDELFAVFPNGDSTQRAGTYPIVLTRANGCDSTLLITVGISPNNYYVPNVFAPNKYGENEAFTIFTNPDCIQTVKLLQIYDRWGSLIFERANFPPNDLGQGWRGDHKGKPMPTGVYACYVELQLNNGAIVPHSGDVTIIR